MSDSESQFELARLVARGARGRAVRKRNKTEALDNPQYSSARADFRDPTALGESLNGLVQQRGWSKELNVYQIMSQWAAIVGPANAEKTQPEAFAKGVLMIRAESTVWANSFRRLTPKIIAILNERLGDNIVTRIDVRGPDAPSWRHGKRTVSGRGPRDTYG